MYMTFGCMKDFDIHVRAIYFLLGRDLEKYCIVIIVAKL